MLTLTPARLGNNSWFFSFSIELCFEILLLRCRLKILNRTLVRCKKIFTSWNLHPKVLSLSFGSYFSFCSFQSFIFGSVWFYAENPRPEIRSHQVMNRYQSLMTRQSRNWGRMKLNLEIKYCLNSFFEFTPIWNNLCVWFCCFLWYFIYYLTVWRLFHFCHFRQKLSFLSQCFRNNLKI